MHFSFARCLHAYVPIEGLNPTSRVVQKILRLIVLLEEKLLYEKNEKIKF